VGGFIDLAQFGIKPERDKYYARVNPKTGCWECVEIPADCQIPTQGKTAHLKFDRVAHARPIMCIPDRVACGCGCGCAACEPTMPDNGDPMPCLRVTKSCDPPGPYKEGEDVVFAFVVENCGNTDIMGIQLVDDMVPVDGGPIDLAPGAIDETTFTAVVTVTGDMVPGGFTNNVTATGSVPDAAGGGVVDATDSHTVTTATCVEITEPFVKEIGPISLQSSDGISPDTGLVHTALDNGTKGDLVAGGSASSFPNSDYPVTLTMPPVAPGCVLMLQASSSFGSPSSPRKDMFLENQTGDLYAASKKICNLPFNTGIESVEAGVWVFEVGDDTGTAGTVDLNFATQPEPWAEDRAAALVWQWSKLELSNGQPLTCSDIDTAAAVDMLNAPTADQLGQEDVTNAAPAAAVDMGACASFIVASKRHAAVSGTNEAASPHSSDWFQHSSADFSETYDQNTENTGTLCQLGQASGVLSGGAGSWTWDAGSNVVIAEPSAGGWACAMPLVCDEDANPVDLSEPCPYSVANGLCAPAVAKCVISGDVALSDGATLSVRANGLELGTVTSSGAFSFPLPDSAAVDPGVFVSGDVQFGVSGGSGDLTDVTMVCLYE
jgi:hypothetical protein